MQGKVITLKGNRLGGARSWPQPNSRARKSGCWGAPDAPSRTPCAVSAFLPTEWGAGRRWCD